MRIGRNQILEWFRRVPRGLLGALALIVLVEAGIEWNAINFQGGSHWSCRVVWREATTGASANRVLCFGDSLIKLGLAPAILETESGLRGYNLAQTGGQPPGSYFLLQQALGSGARPDAIIVDFFPTMLALPTSSNDENWPFLANLGAGWRLAIQNQDLDAFTWHALRLALPSARSRTSIRTWFHFLIWPNPKISIRDEVLKSIRNWQVNRGAEITKSRTEPAIDLNGWEHGYFARFECLPIHRLYIEKFLDLADADQIPVFWLLPPYHPDLQSRLDRSGFDRDHEAFVRQFKARHSSLTVLDARRSSYPASAFHDYHHLGEPGAIALSVAVGQVLRHRLGVSDSPNPWIDLPPYQTHPALRPLETTDDSRVVVRKALLKGQMDTLLR